MKKLDAISICVIFAIAISSLSAGNDAWTKSGSHYSFTRTSKIDGTEIENGGIKYTFSVGVPVGSFDTSDGATTGSPSGINLNISPSTATGEVEYTSDSLPVSDVGITMSGRLIVSGGGSGVLTWGASAVGKAPFYITPREKLTWIDSAVAFVATREANWYIGGIQKHTGLTFSVGQSQNWDPATPGIYAISAKDKKDESITSSASVSIVKCESLNVNANNPENVVISYILEPSSINCSAVFSVGTSQPDYGSVSGNFSFSFNQNLILSTPTTLTLKLSNSDLAEKAFLENGEQSVTTKSDSQSLHTYTLALGQGYRYHSWGGRIKYDAHNYSVPASGKLLEFKALGGDSSYPSEERTAIAHVSTVEGYAYAFTNVLDGATRALMANVASLSPSIFVRGVDFSTEIEKNISSSFAIHPSYSTPDGPALVTVISGGNIYQNLD